MKTYQERTNILLMGMGGISHEQGGSGLTDTMMVVSLHHTNKTVSMISIPRDLWVTPKGIQGNKINSLYGISQRIHDDKSLGYILPKRTIESLFDIPLHYYAVIDFKGFTDVVDALGGIDIDVEKAFTDSLYPDGNYGYMTVDFPKGLQHMDGETALQYVRSRHSSQESGDFSRSRRQQRLIAGIKSKVLSFGTVFKITNIANAVIDNYQSDMQSCEIMRFVSIAKEFDLENVQSLVLDDGAGGVLYTPTEEMRDLHYKGQYILLPDGDSYSIIQQYIHNFLNTKKVELPGKVAVMNGTGVEGLANKVGAILISDGVAVTKRANTSNRVRFNNTIVYAVGDAAPYIDTIEYLQESIGAEFVEQSYEPVTHGADLILIIGGDYSLN